MTKERPRIVVLSPEIAAQIAAGEVIERPASIVKELIENSLDARASQIDVVIEEGGISLIRVRDDGIGIPSDQLADAFARHATSKIRSAAELHAVETLGFRGEALASIAAAADVEMTSRPAAVTAAWGVVFSGGQLVEEGARAAAPGTTIQVEDLFASLPVRRRFLRSTAAEARAVARIVADYSLAYPAVAIQLTSNGRRSLRAPGSGSLRDAVAAVHDVTTASQLLDLSWEAHAEAGPRGEGTGDDDGRARVWVRGLVGPPALHRGNRNYLHLFVNGRAIGSRPLVAVVEQGYAGLIPAGRHPVGVILLEVPGPQVDVNVHPTKSEVRLLYERIVLAAVRRGVVAALSATGAISSELPSHLFEPPSLSRRSEGLALLRGARPASIVRPAEHDRGGIDRPFDQRPDRGRSAGADEREAATPAPLPALRTLGQVDQTYLVTEGPDGLYLIDQHAAHERVLYERVRRTRAGREALSQPLLQAALVELSPAQAALADEVAADLVAVGWEIAETDHSARLVSAVPSSFHGDSVRRRESLDVARLLVEQLDAVEAEERLTGPDRVAASLACRAAVRAGDVLSGEQQRALVEALERTDTPQSCPHGRPTMLHLGRAALERAFGRR